MRTCNAIRFSVSIIYKYVFKIYLLHINFVSFIALFAIPKTITMNTNNVKKMFLKCINPGWVPDGAVSNAVATTNLNHIIKNKQMILMYKHILESVRDGIAQHDIEKIYKFVREEFN